MKGKFPQVHHFERTHKMTAQDLAIRKFILQVQATIIHRVTNEDDPLCQAIERTTHETLSHLSAQEIENLKVALTIHIDLEKV